MNRPIQRLQRSRTDKMLGGVAAGLGAYFNVDPVIVRLIFVTLTITSGVGLPLYIIMWIIMPLAPAQPTTPAAASVPPAAGTTASRTPGTTPPPAQQEPFYAYTSATRRIQVNPMTGDPEEIPVQNVAAEGSTTEPTDDEAVLRRNRVLGLALIGLGAFLVLRMLVPGIMPFVLPALMIAAGIWVLRNR